MSGKEAELLNQNEQLKASFNYPKNPNKMKKFKKNLKG